jgi:hypothetical protein
MGRSDPPEPPREPWTQAILPVAASVDHGPYASREPTTVLAAIRRWRQGRRLRRVESRKAK